VVKIDVSSLASVVRKRTLRNWFHPFPLFPEQKITKKTKVAYAKDKCLQRVDHEVIKAFSCVLLGKSGQVSLGRPSRAAAELSGRRPSSQPLAAEIKWGELPAFALLGVSFVHPRCATD